MSSQNAFKSEFFESDAERIVQKISFPRLVGTEGSERAVNLIIEEFDKADIPLKKEPFQATKFWTTTITQIGTLLALFLSAIMLSLSFIAPEWNLLVFGAIIGLVIWGLAKMSGGSLKMLGKPLDTHNLRGKISPKGEKKGIIILMGHHDTKSQVLTTVQRSAAFTIGGLSVLLAAILYVVMALLALMDTSIPLWMRIISYILSGLIAISTIALTLNFTQNKSPGALDNASSVAVLYMMGKYLKEHALNNIEVWIVITGAEEVGMLGAHEFVRRHKEKLDPKSTYCINFDMVGRKGCCIELMDTTGFPFPKPVCENLNSIAREVAKELQFECKGFYLPTGAATDRFVVAKLGIPAMDFVNKKAAFETHTAKDDLDRFDPVLAKQFAMVATKVVERLDDQQSS